MGNVGVDVGSDNGQSDCQTSKDQHQLLIALICSRGSIGIGMLLPGDIVMRMLM